ncbi:MAG: hypothetical protein WBC02_13440 [Candidatus Aminicenantaceae bacterium]
MPVIGIINGVIRQLGYGKLVGELLAHQISTATGIILFGIYVWLLRLKWRIDSAEQAIIIGFIWLGLTIVFEFIFGHYVMKHPWSKLFHDYNILEGRMWILILIWITIAPYVFFKLRA